MSKKADERKYYLEHLLRLEQYSGRLTRIYKSYIDEFIEISKTVKIDPDKPFSFSDYPQTLERVNKTLSSIADSVKIFFDQATRDEWIESNIKSDALIGTILKNTKIPKSQLEQFYNRNLSALERFQQRKIDGMDLSDRIWRNTEQFKSQIEFGIDTAIGEGRSAAQLARDVKGYLQDPDKLFRRVRNRRGNLVLSKQAEAFNPGRGRYRSSYKNSERLARTEINMSYREADINRYQSLPFVVGYEIRRSNNPYPCIVCETLQGRYPKTFRFNSWHPNCRCFIIYILASKEERREIRRMILNGEDLSTFKSVNEVTDVPEAFKQFVRENADTYMNRKSVPYWIRDNFKNGDISQGLDLKRMKPVSLAPVAKKETPYVFDAEKLQKDGFVVHGRDNGQYSQIVKGFNINEFNSDMMQISNKYGLGIHYKKVSLSKESFEFEFEGDKNFRLMRGFSNGVAYHDLLTIPKDLQGQGLSKEIFQALYKQYQKAEIKEIRVHANIDVGGYTWGKYGFSAKADNFGSIVRQANNALSKKKITESEFKNFDSWIQKYKGKDIPMYELAKKPYGKDLLLDSDWSGYIDLTNKTQREIFEKYLKKSSPK